MTLLQCDEAHTTPGNSENQQNAWYRIKDSPPALSVAERLTELACEGVLEQVVNEIARGHGPLSQLTPVVDVPALKNSDEVGAFDRFMLRQNPKWDGFVRLCLPCELPPDEFEKHTTPRLHLMMFVSKERGPLVPKVIVKGSLDEHRKTARSRLALSSLRWPPDNYHTSETRNNSEKEAL